MSEELSSEKFLAKVKVEASRSRSAVKPRRDVKRSLLKVLGFFFVALGLFLAITFFIVMESTYSQLGSLASVEFASQLESKDIAQLASELGISWLPDFLKIYSIRFPIVLGLLALFGCLALIVFTLAKGRK